MLAIKNKYQGMGALTNFRVLFPHQG